MEENLNQIVQEIRSKFGIVGREHELCKALAAKLAGKHLLLEGEVGVGKTTIALALAKFFNQPFYRIDGDERFTETKLVGHWEPPLVIEFGYDAEKSFVPGPLVRAMLEGGILFINELNRLPESTQNVLLPAMDEGQIIIPKLGVVKAKPGFYIIATQNPEEHVGVTSLSEALRDRFVWIKLNYQTEEEEKEITLLRSGCNDPKIVDLAVKICRATREHPEIKRGASVRGAIDLASLVSKLNSHSVDEWVDAAIMALGTKIVLEDDAGKPVEKIIREIVVSVFQNFQ